MRVGQALGLHVPGPVEVALHEALPPAERRHGLAYGAVVQAGDLLHRAGDLEPASAPAERCFDGDRQAVQGGEGDHLVDAGDGIGGAGHERGADLLGDVPRLDLVAECGDG